jgi:two-component system CheB/CheR fusion protein
VVFEETKAPYDEAVAGTIKDQRVKQLEAELTALREDMRAIVEAQEAANEELQSANEEIVSSNEELQSINEELETSKEEIESTNEELITINQELQIRNEQLAEAHEYSEALFGFMSESILILDKELRVRTANRAFYTTFKVPEQDTEGRLLFDLGNRQWNIPQLRELLEKVVHRNAEFTGFEVQHHFSEIGEKIMLLNACKVIQKVHNQHLVLITIEDITEHRKAQQIVAGREAWFRNMADNAPVMIWVTGTNKLCNFVNKAFLEFRGIALDEAVGKSWTLDAHPDDVDRCLAIYETSFQEKQPFELTYRLKQRDNTYKQVFTKAKPNFTTEGSFAGFIGSCIELDPIVKEAVLA